MPRCRGAKPRASPRRRSLSLPTELIWPAQGPSGSSACGKSRGGRTVWEAVLPAGSNVVRLAFSADGRSLAALDADGSVVALRGRNRPAARAARRTRGRGAQRHDRRELRAACRCRLVRALPSGLAFSPDGRRLAASSGTPVIGLWDVLTGKEVGRFEGHTGSVACLGFTPDGRQADLRELRHDGPGLGGCPSIRAACGIGAPARRQGARRAVVRPRRGGRGASVRGRPRAGRRAPAGRGLRQGTPSPDADGRHRPRRGPGGHPGRREIRAPAGGREGTGKARRAGWPAASRGAARTTRRSRCGNGSSDSSHRAVGSRPRRRLDSRPSGDRAAREDRRQRRPRACSRQWLAGPQTRDRHAMLRPPSPGWLWAHPRCVD